MLVIGDEIIETPMAWPCRYFETHSYRGLLKACFRRGARWTAAPKPQLTEALYDPDYRTPGPGEPMRYVLTEFEPAFDAADFVRAGRDLFVIRSKVTDRLGIEWMRRHLGPGYRIHEIESRRRAPVHIDCRPSPASPPPLRRGAKACCGAAGGPATFGPRSHGQAGDVLRTGGTPVGIPGGGVLPSPTAPTAVHRDIDEERARMQAVSGHGRHSAAAAPAARRASRRPAERPFGRGRGETVNDPRRAHAT